MTTDPVGGVAGIETIPGGGAKALPVTGLPTIIAKVQMDPELLRLDIADLWEFMAYTGCRIGEALALRWSMIDRKKKTVTLGPSVSRVAGKGLFIYEPAKTHESFRTIVVPDSALALIKRRQPLAGDNELGLVVPRVSQDGGDRSR